MGTRKSKNKRTENRQRGGLRESVVGERGGLGGRRGGGGRGGGREGEGGGGGGRGGP